MENNGAQDFVLFTKAERMAQLGEIDRNIVSLLRSTAQAVESIGKKDKQDKQDEDTAMTDTNQAQVFNDSMNDFLRTLRKVNVGMKRQIWGLEEAGIISPGKKDIQNIKEEGGEVQASGTRIGTLEPDGTGKIGGLDVGWLNSRSNKVERDMEAHLWDESERTLRLLLQHNDPNGPYSKPATNP
ncbi:mediator complex, subunit Med11 [Xylariomycetidae sp. FL0641]|nr:mediator complex, subunit Med11 [Xylariomycetidae sp. FL0641]